jgi:mannosyl-oligosaccharide alpha-1,2-mannosidase
LQILPAKRREVVVEMISHTWHSYKNYSWGANELMPVAKKPHSQAIFGGAQMMVNKSSQFS